MTGSPRLRVLRHRDRLPGPWANGGGITYEVARSPAEGPDFDWRLSVAEVAVEGPFSSFPGIDRVLILLSESMRLVIDGIEYDVVPFEPVTFRGEASVESLLPDGPTMDFNVMTRRGVVNADVEIITPETPPDSVVRIESKPGTRIAVLVLDGAWALDGTDEPLGAWDCILAEEEMTLRGGGALASVRLSDGGAHGASRER